MNKLSVTDIDRIIEMAWEDRTTFEAIKFQFGLGEQEVISLMRKEMKLKSFKLWRKRVQGLILVCKPSSLLQFSMSTIASTKRK